LQSHIDSCWSRNSADKIKLRLSEFTDTRLILDCKFGYPIDTFWSKEDIILNVMGETNSYLYATAITDLLITLQRYHTLHTTDQNKDHLKTLVIIDECRSLFPKKSNIHDLDADRYLEQFVTTARSSGIGRITLTQEPQSVTSWLADNAAFFWTFPIAGESLKAIKTYQGLTDEQIAYIAKLPPYGTGIFRDRRFDRPYLIEVPPAVEIETISPLEAKEIMNAYIDDLQKNLEPEIVKPADKSKPYTESDLEKIKVHIHQDTRNILERLEYSLGRRIYLNHTQLKKAVGFTAGKFDSSIKYLHQYNLIKEFELSTTTRPAKLYTLTEKGYDFLQTPKNARIRPRFFRHTYYRDKVAEYLRGEGYSPKIEYRLDNRYRDRIDVFCVQGETRCAYEITLSTSNLILNVANCHRMRADEIIIVWDQSLAKIQDIIKDSKLPDNIKAKVKYARVNSLMPKKGQKGKK